MEQCWHENPAKRPSFSELRASFDSILMEGSSYIQFSSLTDTLAGYYSYTAFRLMLIHCCGIHRSEGPPKSLPATGKASNPYVTNPKIQGQTVKATPLDTPTKDATAANPRYERHKFFDVHH